MRSGAQLVVDQLEAEGITTAFCVPGESYLDVLDALHDSPVRLVTCRQEGGASYMAGAYAKLTGTAGVCLVTRGPGSANAMVGIHAAFQDSIPLVLLVGLIPRQDTQREAFQEFDLRGWFGTTAKAVLEVGQAERAPEIISRAFATARSGRPGPVVVGLPEDMLRDTAAVSAAPPVRIAEPAPGEAALEEITALLAAAERPLVVLGGGGWTGEATRQVQRWVELNELPTAVEFNALDLLDHGSPSYIGSLGYGRSAETAAALAEADVVLGIGSPLGDLTTDSWTLLPTDHPGAALVTVLPDAEGGGAVHPDTLRIVCSVPGFASALERLPAAKPVWAARTRELRRAFSTRPTPLRAGLELDLNEVFAQLQTELPADAVLTVGAGNHAGWAKRHLSRHGYPTFLAARNGSMGYAVPAAVAASLAFPDRRVITVTGDGDFLMNGQELAVAAAEHAAPVILLVNNSMYGTIRTHQERRHPGRVSGTQLHNPDFAAYARAFGGFGEVVTTTAQFLPALRRALAAGVPAILELRVDQDQISTDTTIRELRSPGTAQRA